MNDIRCSQCGLDKPPTAFPLNASKASGHDSECLRCKRARDSTPESRRSKRLRFIQKKYGLTAEQYEALVKAQENRCGICDQHETRLNEFGERVPLAIDHDHFTGKVRGLLCSGCNKGIGLLGDTIMKLLAAIDYLGGAT